MSAYFDAAYFDPAYFDAAAAVAAASAYGSMPFGPPPVYVETRPAFHWPVSAVTTQQAILAAHAKDEEDALIALLLVA